MSKNILDTITLDNVMYDTMSPNLDPLLTKVSLTSNTLNATTLNTTGMNNGNLTSGGTSYTFPTYTYPNVTINAADVSNYKDLIVDGKSLKTFMEKIEERLLILQPDPKKLEKHAALKKAYDHYKLMEKLLGEE
jgi:hypothetical protein